MQQYHPHEANIPPTWLPPTVLGSVLIMGAGGTLSTLSSHPIALPMAMHIDAKIVIIGCTYPHRYRNVLVIKSQITQQSRGGRWHLCERICNKKWSESMSFCGGRMDSIKIAYILIVFQYHLQSTLFLYNIHWGYIRCKRINNTLRICNTNMGWIYLILWGEGGYHQRIKLNTSS